MYYAMNRYNGRGFSFDTKKLRDDFVERKNGCDYISLDLKPYLSISASVARKAFHYRDTWFLRHVSNLSDVDLQLFV